MKNLLLLIFMIYNLQIIQGQEYSGFDLKTTDQKIENFLKIVDTLRVSANNPGLALSIIYEHKTLMSQGIGYSDISKKKKVTTNTIFQAGSLAKAMTGFIAAQLVDEGKINWNDCVKKYLPEFKMADDYLTDHVTIKDLMTHHTGLAQHYYMMYGPRFKRDEILNLLPHMGLSSSLRQKYHYNNFTFTIAGILEERVTGKKWEELVEERIFIPLAMNSSFTKHVEITKLDNVAISHSRDGKTVILEKETDNASNTFGPAGGLYSNVEDLTKWLQLLIHKGINKSDTLLSSKQFSYITNPLVVRYAEHNRFYGIGWDVTTDRKYHSISHNGVTAGQKSRILFIPELGFGIVVLCNQFSDLPSALTKYAEDIFVYGILPDISAAKKHFANQSTDKKNLAPLQKHKIVDASIQNRIKTFCGHYRHPAYGDIEIKLGGKNQLDFKYYDFIGTLKYIDNLNFIAFTNHTTGKDEFTVEYIKDTMGKLTAIEILFPAAPKMIFKKIE